MLLTLPSVNKGSQTELSWVLFTVCHRYNVFYGRYRHCIQRNLLQSLKPNVEDKDKPNERQGEAYKIKWGDCQATYFDGTGENLDTRLTEHKRATRNSDTNKHIAGCHFHNNHIIYWNLVWLDLLKVFTYKYYKRYYQQLILNKRRAKPKPSCTCFIQLAYRQNQQSRQTTEWLNKRTCVTNGRLVDITVPKKANRNAPIFQHGLTDIRPITSWLN